jgi:hypothetical protein
MLVETFYDEEVAVVRDEERELMIEQCEKMGLQEQVELLKNDRPINPYREINAEEMFVYGVHFPNFVAIQNYKSVIPLRVLQISSHYLSVYPDRKVYFMCPEKGKVDPIVIGGRYLWLESGVHILCRFGEALEEFSVLREQAIKKLESAMNLSTLNYNDLDSIAKIVLR